MAGYTNRACRPGAVANWPDLHAALLAAMDTYGASTDSGADRRHYYTTTDAIFAEAELRELANW